jgi:hypothetical protein
MIRRTQGSDRSSHHYDDRYSEDAWDGRERRGVSRHLDDYDGDDRRHHIDQVVIEHTTPKEAPKAPQSWFQSNAALLGITFTLFSSGGTFIFDLYNRVRDLEYKSQTIFEKIAENRELAEEIKGMIKEQDKNKKEVEQQINSLEDTIMQLYRKK